LFGKYFEKKNKSNFCFKSIPENLTIHDLRRYIIDICGDDNDFPKEFLYLRSVGRCLTKVKKQQEKELKVKNYRPPMVCTFLTIFYIGVFIYIFYSLF
jgi:hypothetical protein